MFCAVAVNFINFVVKPLYSAFVLVVPEVQVFVDQMETNKQFYQKLVLNNEMKEKAKQQQEEAETQQAAEEAKQEEDAA